MPSQPTFFLGYGVDDRLRTHLDACDEDERAYLEDPAFLDTIVVDGQTFIGRKLAATGLDLGRVEDSARNVASLIRRVVPDWRTESADAVLLALEEERGVSVDVLGE